MSAGGLKQLSYFQFPTRRPKPSEYEGGVMYITLMIRPVARATRWLRVTYLVAKIIFVIEPSE